MTDILLSSLSNKGCSFIARRTRVFFVVHLSLCLKTMRCVWSRMAAGSEEQAATLTKCVKSTYHCHFVVVGGGGRHARQPFLVMEEICKFGAGLHPKSIFYTIILQNQCLGLWFYNESDSFDAAIVNEIGLFSNVTQLS